MHEGVHTHTKYANSHTHKQKKKKRKNPQRDIHQPHSISYHIMISKYKDFFYFHTHLYGMYEVAL